MFTAKRRVKSLLGVGLAASLAAIALQTSARAQKVQNISQLLVEASEIINQQLPITLDPTVRWDSTSAGPGKLMNYNYTLVTYSANQLDRSSFEQQFRPFVSNILCNESSSQIFRDNDVALNINVYDNSSSLVGKVKVYPAECRSTKLSNNLMR